MYGTTDKRRAHVRSRLLMPLLLLLAAVPLNFTLELALNPIPLIVTTVPYGPLVGVSR